jgi:hypothetical protein
MLPEVVCAEELLGMVTFTKFVDVYQMLYPNIPVNFSCDLAIDTIWSYSTPQELIATVTTGVCLSWASGRAVKCGITTRKCGARPRMATKMKRILMPLSLILVLEAVLAVLAFVLLFHLMCA